MIGLTKQLNWELRTEIGFMTREERKKHFWVKIEKTFPSQIQNSLFELPYRSLKTLMLLRIIFFQILLFHSGLLRCYFIVGYSKKLWLTLLFICLKNNQNFLWRLFQGLYFTVRSKNRYWISFLSSKIHLIFSRILFSVATVSCGSLTTEWRTSWSCWGPRASRTSCRRGSPKRFRTSGKLELLYGSWPGINRWFWWKLPRFGVT